MRSMLLGCLAITLALGACRSPEKTSSPSSAHVPACICGTPEADIDGCPCPTCMSGQGNPDNPDCLCGPLSYEGKGK